MVVKTMPDEDFCKKCAQKQDCKTIYEQLGKQKSPSVALKIVFAFLLPILIFILSLAFCGPLLKNVIKTEKLLTAVNALLAFMITFVYLLSAKMFNEKLQK